MDTSGPEPEAEPDAEAEADLVLDLELIPVNIRQANCVSTFFLGQRGINLRHLCSKITGMSFKCAPTLTHSHSHSHSHTHTH